MLVRLRTKKKPELSVLRLICEGPASSSSAMSTVRNGRCAHGLAKKVTSMSVKSKAGGGCCRVSTASTQLALRRVTLA